MKQSTLSEKAMVVISLLLLAVAIGLFSWIWFGGTRPSSDIYASKENLKSVSVMGLESAKKLIDGLKNNSGIPIPEPTGKEGRADPFAPL